MIRARLSIAVTAVLTLVAAPLAGQTFFGETTVDGPRWQRPVQGNPPTPPPSAIGNNTPYHVFQFAVTVSGTYDFLSTATNPARWDNYLFLYHTSFNAADPFANVLIGNDDFGGVIGLAGFSYGMNAGTNYFLVTTGFANSDYGEFTTLITGPGVAIPGEQVPEPLSMVLLGTGLLGVAAVRRRRRQVHETT